MDTLNSFSWLAIAALMAIIAAAQLADEPAARNSKRFPVKATAVLADDSGLVVDALNGAPGVYSSRYAGEDGNDGANNTKLLHELEGVPDEQRTARFMCVLVFIDEDGSETVAQGSVEGRIGYELKGDGGFGYDPLFWPECFNFECTLAEVTQENKNKVSHRGNALRELKKVLA